MHNRICVTRQLEGLVEWEVVFCAFTHSLLSMSTQCLCRAMASPIRRPSGLKQEVFLVVSRENYHQSSQANTLTRKHLASGRCLPVDLVDEAARRREPAQGKRQEHEREHDQDTTGYQALAKVGSEEARKRRYALANKYERPEEEKEQDRYKEPWCAGIGVTGGEEPHERQKAIGQRADKQPNQQRKRFLANRYEPGIAGLDGEQMFLDIPHRVGTPEGVRRLHLVQHVLELLASRMGLPCGRRNRLIIQGFFAC
jgi:hypothetical protein